MDGGINRRAQVVAFGNQKGGVGKTTNTVHVAAALGEMGRKVLIFDLDMNAGATRHFGVNGEGFLGTFEVLTGTEAPLDVILRDGEEDVQLPQNVDLISSCRKLEQIEQVLLQRNKFLAHHDILIKPLEQLREHYDYVFLDTAPNATSPTLAAYKSSDWFVLTAMPEPFAIAGLNEALTDIRDARDHGNPNLQVLGLILCAVDKRTRLSHDLRNYCKQSFTMKDRSVQFETTISRSTVVGQCQEARRTLFQTHPGHAVTEQYRELARELDERVRAWSKPGEAPDATVVAPDAEPQPPMMEAENG